MKFHSLAIQKLFCLVLTFLIISSLSTPVLADGEGGVFKKLYFSDSTPQKCGGWYVVIDPPDDRTQFVNVTGTISYKVTDGRNKVVTEGTQDVAMSAMSVYGMPSADWTGAVNPIRVVVKTGDRLVADLKGDNPCLSKSKPKPIVFDPVTVKVPKEAIDRVTVKCQRNLIYISSVDPKGRIASLTNVKLLDVIKAGDAGLTKNLRRNGVIFIKVDGQGNFTLTWTGGKFNADGQAANGFAKNFVCAYK